MIKNSDNILNREHAFGMVEFQSMYSKKRGSLNVLHFNYDYRQLLVLIQCNWVIDFTDSDRIIFLRKKHFHSM